MLFPIKHTPLTSPPFNKTLTMLKQGLGAKKMERAMKGLLGASRSSDTAMSSFSSVFNPSTSSTVFKGVIPINPLNASTPNTTNKKGKFACRYCGIEFKMKAHRDHHEKPAHLGG